jgi:Holliday junction resolvasome RuvABC endonuclease subunit
MAEWIVALDTSLRATGWAVGSLEPALCLRPVFGTFRPRQLQPISRLDEIVTFISHHLDVIRAQNGNSVEAVYIEQVAFTSKGAHSKEIAGLWHVVAYELWKQQIPTYAIVPQHLKQYVTGTGKADKSIVVREIYKRWKWDAVDDNQADALGLYALAMGVHGLIPPGNETQQKIVDRIKRGIDLIR